MIPLASGPLKIPYAQLVPKLSNSLVSMTPYLQLGYSIKPITNGFECTKDGHRLMSGSFSNNILSLENLHQQALSVKTSLDLHQSLGHPNDIYLRKLFPFLPTTPVECPDCPLAKMTQSPFPGHFPTPTSPLECIHMNLCGPISPMSKGGNRYFLKIVDGHSRFAHVYPIGISDNGGEFVNHKLKALFDTKGIQHITTSPYTPQQNPFSKRGNRTTIKKTRTLLLTSGAPLSFWGDAVSTTVFLEN